MIGSELPKLKTAFYESHFRHCVRPYLLYIFGTFNSRLVQAEIKCTRQDLFWKFETVGAVCYIEESLKVPIRSEHITDIYITETGTTELENLSHNIIDIFITET